MCRRTLRDLLAQPREDDLDPEFRLRAVKFHIAEDSSFKEIF